MKSYLLIYIITGSYFNCQHAIIQFPDTTKINNRTIDCKSSQIDKNKCEEVVKKENQVLENNSNSKPKFHLIHQPYYLLGILPKTRNFNANGYCPTGIKEVHQYTSLKDGFLETITLGVYSPQTVKVTCQKEG